MTFVPVGMQISSWLDRLDTDVIDVYSCHSLSTETGLLTLGSHGTDGGQVTVVTPDTRTVACWLKGSCKQTPLTATVTVHVPRP